MGTDQVTNAKSAPLVLTKGLYLCLKAQIQFWKIIRRVKVAIDVPINAAEIGSMATKPAHATATKPHSSQRGLPLRLKR